jgi:hypothetical protein
MGTITNHAGLPESIVRAVKADPYSKGDCDFSATQLLKPSRIVALEAIHHDEIEEDAADRLWALMGQLGHAVLERSGVGMVEKRLFADIIAPDGLGGMGFYKVSGALDLVASSTSVDYKFTSTYSCKDGPKPEWIQQLNIGRWLAQQNGIQVDALQIVAIYRDWSKMEAKRSPRDYPQQQAETFDLPVWTINDTEDFVARRVESHNSALAGKLPECTPEERWERKSKWALMKDGNTRATATFDTPQEADEAIAAKHSDEASKKKPAKFTIELRPGESIRCNNYCPVAKFCTQHQQQIQQSNV